MAAKATNPTQQREGSQDERIPVSVAINDSVGVGGLLQRLFRSGGATPESVAALLRRCSSERLRHAILTEIGARWGNTGVQQTLAAVAHHTGPDAALGASAHVGAGNDVPPQEHTNDVAGDRSSLSAPSAALSAGAYQGSEAPHAEPANVGLANPTNLGPSNLGRPSFEPASVELPEPMLSPRAEYERGARRGEVALDYLTQIESAFMPGFRRAVDALDDAAAREFGILMLGGLRKIEGVERELQQLASQAPVLASGPGDAPFDASPLTVEHARMLDTCEILAWRLPAVERLLVERVGPTLFRGDLIMSGQPALPIGSGVLSVLENEAATTIALIATVKTVLEAVPDARPGRCPILTEAQRKAIVHEIAPWRGRPVNFAFLKRVLSEYGVWDGIQDARESAGPSIAEMDAK